MSTDHLLKVDGLSVRFGVMQAVRRVDLHIDRRSAVALVGHNGAGKSTTLTAIADALPPNARRDGQLRWSAADAAGSRRQWAGPAGLVPETGKVFRLLTVDENLTVGMRGTRDGALTRADVYELFPRLAERRQSLAGNLSGGEQQMLAISMALLASPRLLLLDEPTLGLSVPVIEGLCEDLHRLRRELGLTLLLAEAGSAWIHHLAERAYLMDRGCVSGDAIDLSIVDRAALEQRLAEGGIARATQS
ncbi:MAG: ATP-binding cassette domain-containing protein [Burkholderiales bacterium]|nr:ATP-binding cassette domain-containing protein [Burkholderiales bacterium]